MIVEVDGAELFETFSEAWLLDEISGRITGDFDSDTLRNVTFKIAHLSNPTETSAKASRPFVGPPR